MDVSHDGSMVVGSAFRNDLRVWEARTGKEMFKLPGNATMGGNRTVRFSSDDQTLLSYGDNFFLRSWDMLTGKLKAEHRLRPGNPLGGDDDVDDRMQMMMSGMDAAELAPDGKTLLKASGKELRAIAADTGKERFKIEVEGQFGSKMALSRDGKWLATLAVAADSKITVWNLAEAKSVAQFNTTAERFSSVLEFTPDGTSLVTGGNEPVLHFWNAKSGAIQGIVDLPERPGRVAVSGDGKLLAVAFWDTSVLVYDLAKVLKPAKKE